MKNPVDCQMRSRYEFDAARIADKVLAAVPSAGNYGRLVSLLVSELLRYDDEVRGSEFFARHVRPAIYSGRTTSEGRRCLAAFVADALMESVKGARLTDVLNAAQR